MISLADAVAKYRDKYGAIEVLETETNTILKAWCIDWESPASIPDGWNGIEGE